MSVAEQPDAIGPGQQAILDAFPANIALLDEHGVIVAVNEAWRRFGEDNQLAAPTGSVGQSYLDVCDRACGRDAEEAPQVGAGIRAVLAGAEASFSREYPCHAPDQKRWFHLLVTRLQGRPGAVVLHIDVTRERLAREALRDQEALLGSAFRVGGMGSWVYDVASERLSWSPETHALFGIDISTFSGTFDAFEAAVLPADLPHVRAWLARAVSSPEDSFETEYRILRPDGAVRWIDDRGSVERDAGGAAVRRLGVVVDITARKEAEEQRRALLAREQLARKQADDASRYYRSLFESAPGCYLVLSPDRYAIVAVSHAYLEATMTSREAIEGRTFFEVFPDDPGDPGDPAASGAASLRASFDRVKASRQVDVMAVLRYPVRRPMSAGGGFDERFWSPINSPVIGPDGELAYIIHRVEDVTEYVRFKQVAGGGAPRITLAPRAEQLEADIVLRSQQLARANESLARNQALLRIAGQAVKLGGWLLTLPDGVLTWSDETAAIHDEPPGFSPSVEGAIAYYLPASRASVRRAIEASMHDGTPFDIEERITSTKGRLVWVRSIGEAVRSAAGVITHVQGAFQDISVHKAAEEKLREQATLLDAASDAILVRDLAHRVLYWNRGAEQLYGWTAAEALGHEVGALLSGDAETFHAATRETLATGGWKGEMEQTTRDGRVVTVLGRWSLLRDAEGRPRSILAISTDITERKQLEQQLLRAQRMESIGTLAGGIAHDLNNVLAPILLSVAMLQEDETDPDHIEDLLAIESCAQRGAEMVAQLLTFARGGEERRTTVALPAIAGEVRNIVRDTFPKDITFRLKAPARCWGIEADPTQIHQLITNLCVNARDAMPLGGTLTMTIEHVVLDETYVGMNVEAKVGPHVLLTLEDTGTGMPPEVLDRIFEPFFTTKELGRGTGLGLSTAHAIVRRHGGFIRVSSEVGRGTRFKVYLPAEGNGEASEVAALSQPSLPRGKGELILVVDDEELIRKITRRTLERYGYQVLCAANGAEAVALFAQHRAKVVAVLTDMNMPIMDGPATIVALRTLDPEVRVIGSSGLDAGGNVTKAREAGMQIFLPKPYTAETLLRALETLRASAPGWS